MIKYTKRKLIINQNFSLKPKYYFFFPCFLLFPLYLYLRKQNQGAINRSAHTGQGHLKEWNSTESLRPLPSPQGRCRPASFSVTFNLQAGSQWLCPCLHVLLPWTALPLGQSFAPSLPCLCLCPWIPLSRPREVSEWTHVGGSDWTHARGGRVITDRVTGRLHIFLDESLAKMVKGYWSTGFCLENCVVSLCSCQNSNIPS